MVCCISIFTFLKKSLDLLLIVFIEIWVILEGCFICMNLQGFYLSSCGVLALLCYGQNSYLVWFQLLICWRLWTNIWPNMEYILCTVENNMYFSAVGWNQMSVRPIWSRMLLNKEVSLSFCLDNLNSRGVDILHYCFAIYFLLWIS